MPILVKTAATWIDVGTRERETFLSSRASGLDVVDLLRLMSNATVTTITEGPLVATDRPLASSAQHPDASDAWIVTGEDNASHRTQLYIPSPLLSLTIPDLVNYDALQAQWIALEAALPALAVPYSGADLVQLDSAQIARGAGELVQTWRTFTNAVAWARRVLFWRDVHGEARVTELTGLSLSLGSDFDTVMTAFMDVSAAVVTHYFENTMAVFQDPPTTDLYNSVNDYAVFTFADMDGTETTITLPAPDRAIFLPDGKTVDATQANVASFIAQVFTDLLVPSSLLPPVQYVGGRLRKTAVY